MTVTFTPATATAPATARYDPAVPRKGWTVEVTCPECDGLLAHAADARPEPTLTAAVARCTACGCCWHAQLTLTDVTHEIGKKALW